MLVVFSNTLQVEIGMNSDEDQEEGDEWELQKRIELAQWKNDKFLLHNFLFEFFLNPKS